MIEEYYQKNEKQIIDDFFTFLRFKSISSEAEFKGEVDACADWVVENFQSIGFMVEKWETKGHPVIFAHYDKAGPDKPTLLIYNHYDVQPVDPLEEWESDPFEPTVRDGEVYARGAQDNKGQCFYTFQALKGVLATQGSLPVNIKMCIEGEEECGSEALSALLPQKSEKLQADYLAIVDMGIPHPEQPAVTLGVRGITTMEVEVEGSKGDLHSGTHGGVVFNPIHALVQILGHLRDDDGKVLVPGFYDEVEELNDEHKKVIAFDFDHDRYHEMFATTPSGGEKSFSPFERAWIRPTIEINGIYGGYAGCGFKTVIPAKAGAKISCRLVPNQDPERISQLVKGFLEMRAPEGVRVNVTLHPGSGRAIRSTPASKIAQAFSTSYEEIFQKPCLYTFDGGSIPIVQELADACGGEVVLLGLGLPDDQIHAPNEHFGLDRIKKGTFIIANALESLSKSH